jgi:hypothetical protein
MYAGRVLEATRRACELTGSNHRTEGEEMSDSYASYQDVPWFRKSWFILVGFLIFAPSTLYSLFTGDIYYQKKGQLVTYSKGVKIVTIVLCLMASIYWVGVLFGMH